MTGFLDALADQALGRTSPGGARPALLPRFAAPAPMETGLPDQVQAERSAPRVNVPRSTGPAVGVAGTPDARLTPTDAAIERPVASPGMPSLPDRPAEGHPVATAPVAPAPAPIADPAASIADRRQPLAPTPLQSPAYAAAPPRRQPPTAPLRDEAVAARLAPPAPAPVAPVIQVTIDRLEVRAPARAAPALAPAPRRPAPTQSLTDYLRERGGGRRG